MRAWLGVGVAAITVGGAVWALGGSTLDEPEVTADARVKARGDAEPRARKRDPDASLETRVAELEDEVDALRREVQRLRVRPVATGPSGPSNLDMPDPEDPAFEHAVRSVVEQERAAQEEARLERRRDQWDARLEELSAELGQRAGLGDEQTQQVVGLWSTEAEEILPLITAARSGEGSFREVREQIEAIRIRTDEQAAQLLSGTQLEVYEELRPRGPGGRGDRRDRDRRRAER